MAFEIILDRRYYSRTTHILMWLEQHVGPGSVFGHGVPDDHTWTWDQNFGHTWLTFKHEADLVQFKLTWC